ncbi:MAG: P1 family peptidase [Candidatus Eremiobacteraeota bacterium]|nr:P1 family peptidase [Candidatus Eremiobacteraeota bacterium]
MLTRKTPVPAAGLASPIKRRTFLALAGVSVLIPGPVAAAADEKPGALHAGPFASGEADGITDVPGVRVAHLTKIEGEGQLRPGIGPVRTGATAILPNADPWMQRCAAGTFILNGNGEMTGVHWIDESGFLEEPVLLTATTNVPRVADGVIDWLLRQHPDVGVRSDVPLPVVAECNDQALNDTQGRHVHPGDIPALVDAARGGAFARGSVGAGTGMRAFSFKAGIGSASRRLPANLGSYTVGVLLNANSGSRAQLMMAGVPVGRALQNEFLPVFPRRAAAERARETDGSIIIIVATDAPLEPRVLRALAKRTALGLARTGWTSTVSSGDLMLAFSTTNLTPREGDRHGLTVEEDEDRLDALYQATTDATESAVYDALWNATTMVGAGGRTFYGLPHDRVRALLAGR